MRRSLKQIWGRLNALDAALRPSPKRLLNDEELETQLEEVLTEAVGPIDEFDTADAFSDALDNVFGKRTTDGSESEREIWQRSRWLRHHASHGPFQLGPRWCQEPLLSCACGGHVHIYRRLIPAEFWSRITEDDEPRTAYYYPLYPPGPDTSSASCGPGS